jgi:hypothetical protein
MADKAPRGKPPERDHNIDRFPTAVEALRRVAQDERLIQGPIHRIDVRTDAAGNVFYRVWAPRAEDPEIGFVGHD